jgi:heat shock protein HslJ
MSKNLLFQSSMLLVVAAAVLISAPPSAVCGGPAASDSITGIEWRWQQTLLGNGQSAVPDDPGRYTIAFQPDGTLYIRADCNRVGGNYTIKNSSLMIETTHSTRAMCPPDSLDQTFLKHLNAAAIYFMREGHLYIDLKYDTGTMKFSK